MFPVRYELNSYINLLRNSVFKGLICINITKKHLFSFVEGTFHSDQLRVSRPQSCGVLSTIYQCSVLHLADGLYCACLVNPIWCWCRCPKIKSNSVDWARLNSFHQNLVPLDLQPGTLTTRPQRRS
jgi:hypothetical protein